MGEGGLLVHDFMEAVDVLDGEIYALAPHQLLHETTLFGGENDQAGGLGEKSKRFCRTRIIPII